MSDDPQQEHFPSPLVALGLTLAGVLATAFATLFVVGLLGGAVSVASIGIGQALGLGAVATFAFQRVAAAQRERLGLRGFALSLAPILLMLLPLVVVLSELDNTIRALLPPVELPPEIEEIQAMLEAGQGNPDEIHQVVTCKRHGQCKGPHQHRNFHNINPGKQYCIRRSNQFGYHNYITLNSRAPFFVLYIPDNPVFDIIDIV